MISHFYTIGGTLRQDAPSYVERQADRDLYAGLLAGEFCYVLTSRQMRKSSLMVRTAARGSTAARSAKRTSAACRSSSDSISGSTIRVCGRNEE
jgi:hypothetical protein